MGDGDAWRLPSTACVCLVIVYDKAYTVRNVFGESGLFFLILYYTVNRTDVGQTAVTTHQQQPINITTSVLL